MKVLRNIWIILKGLYSFVQAFDEVTKQAKELEKVMKRTEGIFGEIKAKDILKDLERQAQKQCFMPNHKFIVSSLKGINNFKAE